LKAFSYAVVNSLYARTEAELGQENTIFTALHKMQTRSSDENSLYPSVCPSVCHTRDPWQNGRKFGADFYTIRKII